MLRDDAETETPSGPTLRRSSMRSALSSASPAPTPEAAPQSIQSRQRRGRTTPVSQVGKAAEISSQVLHEYRIPAW